MGGGIHVKNISTIPPAHNSATCEQELGVLLPVIIRLPEGFPGDHTSNCGDTFTSEDTGGTSDWTSDTYASDSSCLVEAC